MVQAVTICVNSVCAGDSTNALPVLWLVTCTEDDGSNGFFELLAQQKFDVVMFAPGACRWDAQGSPIPGGCSKSKGWGLKEYKAMVKEKQGDSVAIVGTTDEREVVPVLRQALGI